MMLNRGRDAALFKVGGVQRNWGIENAAWDYAFGSGEVAIEIPIGQYRTGTFDHTVWAMNNDADMGSSGVVPDIMFDVAAENGSLARDKDRSAHPDDGDIAAAIGPHTVDLFDFYDIA